MDRAASRLRPNSRESMKWGGAWRTFYHTAYVCRIKNQCGITATNTTRPPWLSSCPSTCPSGEWWGDTHAFCVSPLLPALCASPKRISVMLLGSLWDLPRCNTQSSSSPSDDAMVTADVQFHNERRHQPRSSARRAGADLMWLECCGCSSWCTIRSRAGEIHYAHSIMPPSGAARKILL